MTFISHAPNFEDVLLWRALHAVDAGFYIDIGAGDPAHGSVTQALAERGWAGVNVDPAPAAFAALAAMRPHDVNLACIVGPAPGEAGGVPVRTLAAICGEHAPGTVHVLRIGAAAAAVLAGADFAACQPWVILVRAAVPGPEWEAGLLAAGYRFVWFDGVNRFYVAQAHHAALSAAFTTPPNQHDDFIRATDSALARRVAEAEAGLRLAHAEAGLATSRADASARRLLDATRATGAARIVALERDGTVHWLRAMLADAQDTARRVREEAEWLRGQVEALQRVAEDRAHQLAAHAEQAAWLRNCLAESEASLAALRQEKDVLAQRLQATDAWGSSEAARAARAEAMAQAAQAQWLVVRQANVALRTSVSWRVTAPLRRARAVVLGQTAPPDAEAEPPAVLPEPALPPATRPVPVPVPVPHPTAARPSPAQPSPVPHSRESQAAPSPTPAAPPTTPFAPNTSPNTSPDTSPDAAPAPEPPAPQLLHAALQLPALRHAVHQFHYGSATGDAITNAMLMLRGILRGLGYASDIFVVHRGAGLEQELLLFDAMPRHDGFVLLVHHSMGHTAFDALVAVPAPKVLVYHNITPPEFLDHLPEGQHFARVGRDQLAAWRHHVVAALAMSEFNALELRDLGFPAVRSAALLFDVTALRQHTLPRPPRAAALITILFVGRMTPSKAQDDLVAAYAAFRQLCARPSRLVLVGAFDADQSGYLDALDAAVQQAGLAEHVVMTGLVPDDELHAWYGQASLYVSLSHHEGFGVPLVEAMAHGVPVLAWPAGAVPYTLGGAAALLATRTPEGVAAQMLALLEDPAAMAGIVARQSAALARFALPHHLPALLEALGLAGAQPRPDGPTHAVLAANMRLSVAGHVNKTYSLAAVNRAIAAAFEAQRPGTARLIPVEGAPTDFLDEVPEEARAMVAALAARPPAVTGPEVVISQHYPVYVPEHRGDLLLAIVAWEETLLPPATVAVLNAAFDGILAPSAFVVRALVDSGVGIPVVNLSEAPPLAAFATLPSRPAGEPFTFLHVSSAFPRKGVDALLAAWRLAFREGDGVQLIIKTFPNPHNDTAAQIARLRAADPDAAPITLIDEDLSEAAQLALFAAADAMVLPTRGEGFNLVAAEAMAAGLPLIVTDTGGHRDFCGPLTARLVRSQPAPSLSHLATAHSLWREPDEADLAAAMREAAAGTPPGRTAAARAAILAHADPADFVDRLAAIAATLLLARPVPPARVAWVTSWAVRCGVAGYTQALLAAMPPGGVARHAILCDARTPGDGDRVRPCWQQGGEGGTAALLAAVQQEDAGVVVVQHQPGLLTWSALAELLAALVADGRAVVVTLHNTLHLLEEPEDARAASVAALGSVARVLVHTLADLRRLEALGLRPSLLPHGAPAPGPAQPARALPPGSAPVIGCYGFFLPGKGIGALIDAVARLRGTWPAIRLRLVNAAYGTADSADEIAACRAQAEACGLAVEWHQAFLPEAESMALLAGCDLVALPYAASREASSAALRSALASGVPVAVTPVALFDEAGAAVARLPGSDPAALAEGLAALLDDPAARDALVAASQAWLSERAVPEIALRLHGMVRGLAAQREIGAPFDGRLWTPTVPGAVGVA